MHWWALLKGVALPGRMGTSSLAYTVVLNGTLSPRDRLLSKAGISIWEATRPEIPVLVGSSL